MTARLALEVAEASRVPVTESEFVQARRNTSDIVVCARRLARLQAKRTALRRELRRLDGEIKHEKKMLRAIAGASK